MHGGCSIEATRRKSEENAGAMIGRAEGTGLDGKGEIVLGGSGRDIP